MSNPTNPNSELREASQALFDMGYWCAVNDNGDDSTHIQHVIVYETVVKRLIASERQRLLDAFEKSVDMLEIDVEATRKHIETVAPKEGLDDVAIEHRILNMEIEADDRHEVLNDVRTAVTALREEKL